MAGCLLALACAPDRDGRVAVIETILDRRAAHLEPAERQEIAEALVRAERTTGVDALLLVAVAEEESRFRSGARSHRGALGLLQVLPETGRAVAGRHDIPWNGESTLLEPSRNLMIGAAYLGDLRERLGSWELALTAYNQGLTRARSQARRGRDSSSGYASRVLRRVQALRRSVGAP